VLPEAHLCSQTSGRVRIRIPSKKGDPVYFAGLKDLVSKFPGVQDVVVNPQTGSLLVLHDLDVRGVDLSTLGSHTEMIGLFRIAPVQAGQGSVSQRVTDVFRDANRGVQRFTRGELDLPTLVFIGLLGLGVAQIARGKLTAPAWYVAFWYAFNVFMKAQPAGGTVRQGE